MITISSSHSSASRPGCFGMAFGILFCLAFAVFGLVFSYLLLQNLVQTAGTYRWPLESCSVLESRVEDIDDKHKEYRPYIRYQLRKKGKLFTSEKVQQRTWRDSDIGKVNRFLQKYQPGAKVDCYQNPNRLDELILLRHGFGEAFFLIIPFIFVAIGVFGIWSIFHSKGTTPTTSKSSRHSISKRGSSETAGGVFLIVFFGFFFLGGVLAGWLMIPDLLRAYNSSGWKKTNARIISSEVRSHDSDDGTTYSVDILYEYSVAGRTLRSNTYRGFGGSSSGYASKKAIVDTYKPGQTTSCYVNPEDPTYAVLIPGVGWSVLFGLIPLIFSGVGLAGIYWGIRTLRNRAKPSGLAGYHSGPAQRNAVHTGIPSGVPASGPVVLQAKSSPLGRFLGMLFVALFWNGIISIFLFHIIESFQRGQPQYFLVLFFLPFGIIGLLLLWGFFHAFFGLFLPRPRLLISRMPIALGETAEITWQIPSRSSKIKALHLLLLGSEEATYRQGTDRNTATEQFYEEDFHLADQHSMRNEGKVTIRIPAKSMHSFKADNNRIIWKLKLAGEIAMMPDIKEEYEIQVLPARLGGDAS